MQKVINICLVSAVAVLGLTQALPVIVNQNMRGDELLDYNEEGQKAFLQCFKENSDGPGAIDVSIYRKPGEQPLRSFDFANQYNRFGQTTYLVTHLARVPCRHGRFG